MMRSESLHARGTSAGAKPWARLALVTAQIALTVAMLGSSSLLLRSLWNLASAPLGFDTAQVLTVPITLNAVKYRTSEQQVAFFESLLDRASRIPGTLSAAVTDSLPPRGPTAALIFSNIEVEGRPAPPEGTGGMIPWRLVSPRYFDVLHVPIARGRAFQEYDREAAEPAVILSESLARRLYPGEDPIGKHIRPTRGRGPWNVVVGIAKDATEKSTFYLVRRRTPDDPQRIWRSSILILRTNASAAWLRQEISSLDPQLPVNIETMEHRISEQWTPRRFTASLVALFAAFALLLAVAGLSGTASYLVEQRRREIGVRMALGATPASVARQVLREAALWTAAGACGGIAMASAASKLIRSQFVGVTAADPLSWSAAIGILALALAAAVMRPAIRAARTDPAVTLRSE
jgi:predicted permease